MDRYRPIGCRGIVSESRRVHTFGRKSGFDYARLGRNRGLPLSGHSKTKGNSAGPRNGSDPFSDPEPFLNPAQCQPPVWFWPEIPALAIVYGMKSLFKFILLIAVVAGAGAAAYRPATELWRNHNKAEWDRVEVVEGDITRTVNSTGTVQPVLKVSVGSFVSGPIVELNVDFNDEVKQGELLAKVDPRLYLATVQQAEATLATREAEMERIEAQLQLALNNYERGKRLRGKNEDFMSDRDMDTLEFEVRSLQASRRLAKAGIAQATASLENAQANLEYTDITSPVDGVVLDRKIDPGQTLAAQFQAPELFIVAPDLREKVHVFASVNEAYIGLIQQAQTEDRAVEFTVDAHPDELFYGSIEQIRVSSTIEQTVVTYPVVVAARNPELKLLPGMTATITFEVESKQDVVKIPNEALRFYPSDAKQVRPEDRQLLDSSRWQGQAGIFDDLENQDEQAEEELTAGDKTEAHKKNSTRHVWAVDGDLLKAIEVVTGISDLRYHELVAGELQVGDQLVVGQKD